MISLRKRPRKSEDDDDNNSPGPSRDVQLSVAPKPFTIRDKLLQREVMELTPEVLPLSVRVRFPNPNSLHHILVCIKPTEGYWKGGSFDFEVNVPEEYNMVPPKVRCLTPAWHPNISFLRGEVCLSLLRVSTVDDMGWTPTRHLKDVILGLDALFNDLVNFDDPLNQDAADQYRVNRELFLKKVNELIHQNAYNQR